MTSTNTPTFDLPTPPTQPMVAVTVRTTESLIDLLGLVEEFLRTASPQVHGELRRYLADQWPPADPCWLIDMLGFTNLHLRHQLGAQISSEDAR